MQLKPFSDFKVGISTSKKIIFLYFNESPLKMMKNAFYFMLKTFSVLEMFTIFCYVEKRLDKKVIVNFKIYDVTDWAKIITIHILPNISRSKDNYAMKFGQLIKYNMRNIFLEKSYTKYVGETST